MKTIISILIGIIILSAGYLHWQEARYGTNQLPDSTEGTDESREIAVVSNSVEGTVSLVDIEQRTVVSTFSIIPDGNRVGIFRDPIQFFAQSYVEDQAGLNYAQDSDLSPDGRVLFVSRGLLGDVIAYDLAAQAVIWRTPISGVRADHMDISPDGHSLFVSAIIFGGNVVQQLDSRTGDIIGEFETGNWPHDIHVSEDGQTVYAASIGDMTIPVEERDADDRSYLLSIADLGNSARTRELSFRNGIRPFQISADGKTLFGQQSNTHDLFVHDLVTNKPKDQLSLPVAEGVSEEDWDFEAPHHGLALTRNGAMLCVAARASDYAAIVRANPLALIKTVPVGDAPSWSALSRDDRYCLTANNRDDTVSIIAMDEAEEVARLPVGRAAKHITVGMIPEDVINQLPPSR